MQGGVGLCYVKADRLGIKPATCQSQVQSPIAAPLCNTNAWSVCLSICWLCSWTLQKWLN